MKASRLGRRPSRPSATGHWRAINQGVMGLITVTSGASTAQVSVVRGSDLSDSQADSATSLTATRSHVKARVGEVVSNTDGLFASPRRCRLGRLRSR